MLNSVRNFLEQGDTMPLLLLLLIILVALLLMGWLRTTVRLNRLTHQLKALTRGQEGQNLAEVLTSHLEAVHLSTRRMDSLEQAVAVLQAQMPKSLQKVGMVRYDAFEDVGGEQSFSVALLDAKGDGIILTSVYSRMDVRVYAKAIQNGRASHALSQEEERVLRESTK